MNLVTSWEAKSECATHGSPGFTIWSQSMAKFMGLQIYVSF